jgi:hypothetical protein
VAGERGENIAGSGEVVAELRAAEGMGEGVDAVDLAGVEDGGALGDLLRGARDAADGGDDPDLVAGADAAIGAVVAIENPPPPGGGGRRSLTEGADGYPLSSCVLPLRHLWRHLPLAGED